MKTTKNGNNIHFDKNEIENKENQKKKKKSKHMKTKEDDKFNFDEEIVIGVNEEKNKPKRKQKNKKKKNKLVPFFSIIIIIFIIIIFSLTAPIFNITEIKVEGNENLNENTIISLSEIKKGENIFKLSKENACTNIKSNNYIDNVKIERKLPGSIVIKIKERTAKYQISFINSVTYIDKNGYILENSTIKKEIPVIVGLEIKENEIMTEKKLKEKDLDSLTNISKIMDSAKTIDIENIISEINIEDKNNYILHIATKNKHIHLGTISNLTNKMLYIKKILENEEGKNGTIFVNGDISAGFKPYFREE